MPGQIYVACFILLHQPFVIAVVFALPIQISFVVFCGTPICTLHVVIIVINHHPAHTQQVAGLEFSTVEHKWQAENNAESFVARHVMLSDLTHQYLLKDGSSSRIILCRIGDVLDSVFKTLGTCCRFEHVLQHIVQQLRDAFDDLCGSVAPPSHEEFLNCDDYPGVISSQQ